MKWTQTIRDYVYRKTVSDRVDTILTGAYVSQGEIDVTKYKSLAIFPIYTKGDETTSELKIAVLHTSGGAEHQIGDYSSTSGILTAEAYEYQYSVTANIVPIELDVTNLSLIKIYVKATGGTPTGKMEIDYTLSNTV